MQISCQIDFSVHKSSLNSVFVSLFSQFLHQSVCDPDLIVCFPVVVCQFWPNSSLCVSVSLLRAAVLFFLFFFFAGNAKWCSNRQTEWAAFRIMYVCMSDCRAGVSKVHVCLKYCAIGNYTPSSQPLYTAGHFRTPVRIANNARLWYHKATGWWNVKDDLQFCFLFSKPSGSTSTEDA